MATANLKLATAAHDRLVGTATNPGPTRLAVEWAFEKGPAKRSLDGSTSFAQNLSRSRSINTIRQKFLNDFDGSPQNGDSKSYQMTFGPREYIQAGPEEHFLGSYSVTVEVADEGLNFTVTNRSSRTSFFAGTPARWLNKEIGFDLIPQAQSLEREQTKLDGGNTVQTITWTENFASPNNENTGAESKNE
jgi:hypothetical protein